MKRNVLFILAVLSCASVALADNELTDKEQREGWQLLFDGKTMNGWTTNALKPSLTPVEDGAINPHGYGNYMVIHEKDWSDFILSLDYKISKGCNSGVFLRTFPLLPDGNVGYNGIEVAIDDTAPRAEFHDTGAFYDLVAPRKNPQKPVGEWNHLVIQAQSNIITVELNGEKVNRINLDEWTEPGKRPDGSPHKFPKNTWKNHPRHGYIGLQDHGSPCWYKNIKIKSLVPATQSAPSTSTAPAK